MSAEGANEVMSQEAPTASISPPKFETTLALQMEAKAREWNGASVGESRSELGNNEYRRERAVTSRKS